MYERHRKFIGWVRKGNFSEYHRSYCEYIKMMAYRDIRALRDINIQLVKLIGYMYNYLGGYDDLAYLKIRHLHGTIGSMIDRIEDHNNEAYDMREEMLRERYYENDGP